MMKRSRVCDLLGIRYPIIQGAVGGRHLELAAAVSQAGGLGTLHSTSAARGLGKEEKFSKPGEELAKSASELAQETRKQRIRESIREMRKLTNNPFSLNIPISVLPRNIVDDLVSTAIEERLKVVTTSAGSPRIYTQRLKEANIKVLHVVSTTEHAVKAADAGVDAVIASGIEAGGWQSFDEVTTFTLIPQVVEAVEGKIPVIATGGIGDARGVVAAFSLGAEGVQMGTRFIATIEHSVDESMKELILRATDTSTEITGRGKSPARNFTIEFLENVRPGYTRGVVGPGQVCGLITEILSVKEVFERIVEGVSEVHRRLSEELMSFLCQGT